MSSSRSRRSVGRGVVYRRSVIEDMASVRSTGSAVFCDVPLTPMWSRLVDEDDEVDCDEEDSICPISSALLLVLLWFPFLHPGQ